MSHAHPKILNEVFNLQLATDDDIVTVVQAEQQNSSQCVVIHKLLKYNLSVYYSGKNYFAGVAAVVFWFYK